MLQLLVLTSLPCISVSPVCHQTALKTLDAGEVLSENPEMKGVHSVASTRSMLQKLDGRGLPQPGGCCS